MLAMCLKNKNIAALAQPLIFHIGTRLPTQSSDRPKEKNLLDIWLHVRKPSHRNS